MPAGAVFLAVQLLLPYDDHYRSQRKSRSRGSVACDWNFHTVNVVMASLPRISVPKGTGSRRGVVVALRLSLIKTASPSFQSILNELRPDKFDDARVVVAICEVIQGRETMRLARPFHVSQLGH